MVAGLAWIGYLVTLAPTVTLWDAGEFITAARVLGIPHPPGTPLFVLLGSAWGHIVAVGEYAWRLNLMSATFSAAGAGCFFLVAHRVLAGLAPLERVAAAAGASLAAAFGFTAWQNSNETEVYMVATCSIAAICWLCLRWRDTRGTARAAPALLVIAYLAALSIGNHLMTLLAGPAVSAFVFHVLRSAPHPDPAERRTEWSEWAVLSALWVLLIAVGLGSTPLIVLGGVLFAAATAAALRARAVAFPLAALAVGAIGVSTYAFLYIRSGLDPVLDMSDPETWPRLLSVIRREQYEARSPLDNPLFRSGPDNPGRTPLLVGQQIVNYLQYSGWQWARGLAADAGGVRLALGLVVTIAFAALGVAGFVWLRRRDRSAAWLLGVLWLVTGLGMVGYMNFKPGFSLFWDQYPTIAQHEVRERDYFFTPSFQLWGVFAGLGLTTVAARAGLAGLAGRRRAALPLAAALVPFALNFTAASRRSGPDATLARDFAWNLLQSVEPYGVLFTFGDNDTYPVWYAQDVEGVRQDVVNVNLSLANASWYLRHVRDRPQRPYDAAAGPAVYRRDGDPRRPTRPVLDVPDSVLDGLTPVRLDRDLVVRAGDLDVPLPRDAVVGVAQQTTLLILQQELAGGRPITFGVSSGRGAWAGLESRLLQRGLVFQVAPARFDTGATIVVGLQALAVDLPRTALLADSTFRYGRLFAVDTLVLDPAARQVTMSLALPYLELGRAAAERGDRAAALRHLRRAYHLSPNAGLAQVIAALAVEAPARP